MRKFVVIAVVILLAGYAWAENSFVNYPGNMPVWGYPGATKTVYVDNSAKTIQQMYEAGGGTWLGGHDSATRPIGMLIVCDTTETHWAFGGSTPSATLGIPLPADSSWQLIGPYWMSTGKGYGNTASDNVTCNMNPIY